MYSRWRHPPKTISPRPYCRSRRGRNGLCSETSDMAAEGYSENQIAMIGRWNSDAYKRYIKPDRITCI